MERIFHNPWTKIRNIALSRTSSWPIKFWIVIEPLVIIKTIFLKTFLHIIIGKKMDWQWVSKLSTLLAAKMLIKLWIIKIYYLIEFHMINTEIHRLTMPGTAAKIMEWWVHWDLLINMLPITQVNPTALENLAQGLLLVKTSLVLAVACNRI